MVIIPIALAIVVISVVRWALKLADKLWVRPKQLEKCLRELGFTGNPYRFLYGDTKDFARMRSEAKSKRIDISDDNRSRVLPYHHHIIKEYGNNSFIWFGAKPRLNIMDPVMVREIYSRPNEFHKLNPDRVAEEVVGGLLTAHGETWAKHRKIINPAFHLDKLKCMVPAIHSSCEDMIRKWEQIVGIGGSAEVDVWPYMEDLSSDVITRAAFGSSNHGQRTTLFSLHKQQTDVGFEYMAKTYTPAILPTLFSSLFPSKLNKRTVEIEVEIQALLKNMVDRRLKAIQNGEPNKDDLLGTLLEAYFKEKDDGMRMSMAEVMDECKMFLTAGANSTSRLLVWTMILLSANPHWQIRAREEVLQVFGNNKVDFDGLSRLKIVTMILQEVLRLYPPTSMALRAVSKKTKLGNLVIPAWVQITLPIILHQQDPAIWGDDATEFKPERFSEGVSNATKSKISSAFMPFSGGSRICIGHNFAMVEAKIAIAIILQRFSFELSSSYVHAPELLFLLRPQYGAKLILHKLN